MAAGWEGSITNWGYATGTNLVVHNGCGLNVSDAHPQYPTEAFNWQSDTFAAWSELCPGPHTKRYATSYTISSTPSGIPLAFTFSGVGTSSVKLISSAGEIFPCSLWPSGHPDSHLYLINFVAGFEGGSPVIPSPSSYKAKPEFMDFNCEITATFPTNSCPSTLISQEFIISIRTNWSARASDLIIGFDQNKYVSIGEKDGLGPTYFHPTTGEIMTGEEWKNYICSTSGGISRFLSGTPHNMF